MERTGYIYRNFCHIVDEDCKRDEHISFTVECCYDDKNVYIYQITCFRQDLSHETPNQTFVDDVIFEVLNNDGRRIDDILCEFLADYFLDSRYSRPTLDVAKTT